MRLFMSIKTRLDKLEALAGGDRCPHNEIHVWYGDDGSGQERPIPDEPPKSARCRQCGGEAVLLIVEYDSKKIDAAS
jgi:hypothetical protein